MFSTIRIATMAAAVAAFGFTSLPAFSAEKPNDKIYWEIVRTLGIVPKFFTLFPEAQLPGVWREYKDLELSSTTALDARTKELIALAVSAQIACYACLTFHSAAATANGATGKEIQEAVGLAVMTGAWSKVLTNQQVDLVRKDVGALLSVGKLKVKSVATN